MGQAQSIGSILGGLPEQLVARGNRPGMKVDEGHCDRHGPYSHSVPEHIQGGCPMCAIEEADRQRWRQDREEQQLRKREKAQRRLLEQKEAAEGLIPKRWRNRDARFENYYPHTDSQTDALAAMRELASGVCDDPEGVQSLILQGEIGTGKTHLAIAAIRQALSSGRTAYFTKVARLMKRIKRTYGNRGDEDELSILDSLSTVDLLVLDELGGNTGSDTDSRLLHEIIDERYDNDLPTVILTNIAVENLDQATGGEAATSRLMADGGQLIVVSGPDARLEPIQERPRSNPGKLL
ncbi:hypothetical protein GM160_08115 [Guyparkeria halophila]|uniref:IstB-like ATP-binding domain-containing protein n=1 Tax=Guyparkeria halophila TaxID=47960 RepID=A0A6I6D5U6_9GAMM|nr:ATP-binding protein [Guyparkeria halophila]QGT78864.1 hypothetical protein GM160_08115 [Guyparkeria halophila]